MNRFISLNTARNIYRNYYVAHYEKTGEHLDKTPEEIVDENNLWLADEWTHLGMILVTCQENMKLVEGYKKGNVKLLDALMGKVIKYSGNTVEPELVKGMIPLVIEKYFP